MGNKSGKKEGLTNMKYLQKLGKAIVLPVACMPLCGILAFLSLISRVLSPKRRRILTLLESAAIKQHPVYGYQILTME